MRHLWTAAFTALLCGACTTNPFTQPRSELSQVSTRTEGTNYDAIIEASSAGDADFAGFYNTFAYKATLQNSPAREALVNKQAEYYQWDEAKTASEREKSRQEMASETDIFLSFFTPERRNDNLADTKSIWRVLLDVGGHRYVGKVKRLRTLLAEQQALYPYHTRWNTPYLVTFPVPTTAIETQPATMTVTGPLGTRTVNFPPVR
jgi:hypothetical protein